MKNKKNKVSIASSTRYFNNIDKVSRNYIKKTSTYSSKFFDEVMWFVKLPNKLKRFVPHVKDYSLEGKEISITYEFLSAPTIHQKLMLDEKDYNYWLDARKQYNKFLKTCRNIHPSKFNAKYWSDQAEAMYIIKTIDRLKVVLEDKKMSYFFKTKFININGIKYPSLTTILSYLESGLKNKYKGDDYSLLKETITPLKEDVCFIHGDLVFSNVFSYRPIYFNKFVYFGLNKFKCIDPRGSFGINKDYGDIVYDYSKIYQCVYGYYDFLIEGLFTYKQNKDNFTYRFNANGAIALCKSAFDSLFPKKYLDRIRIIESLQFLSMAPLHSDKPEHELVILAHGIVRFCGALRKVWK